MIPAAILVAVVLTSLLSGVMGMAGGMVLMAVLASLLTIPAAMILHGVTQATSNGSRAWFLRSHIQWRVLPGYIIGAALCLAAFFSLQFVPDPAVVLILIGLFPWLGRAMPRTLPLDILRPGSATVCGALVTAAQLLAGASGPLLDVFFLRSDLDRRAVVATKAVTQTLGHFAKLGYYTTLLVIAGETLIDLPGLAPWLLAAVVPAALVGTRIGTGILERMDEARFRRYSEAIILTLGAACVLLGIARLLQSSTS